MKKPLLAFPLLMLGVLPPAFSADQNVPTTRTFQVQSDAALKAKVPEAVLQKGFIVAGTNPNTPPTTFYQEDNKTLAGREIDIMNAIGDRHFGGVGLWRRHDIGADAPIQQPRIGGGQLGLHLVLPWRPDTGAAVSLV